MRRQKSPAARKRALRARQSTGAPVDAAAKRQHQPSATANAIQREQGLVERCLAGQPAAWQELYRVYHDGLLAAIASALPSGRRDRDVVEEVAARVWYALVRNRGALLGRFDPTRGCKLGSFLAGVARMIARQYVRSERRRRRREKAGARKALRRPHSSEMSDCELPAVLDEFSRALTPGEQRFINEVLVGSRLGQQSGSKPCSRANMWQHRHRLRCKLQRFLLQPET